MRLTKQQATENAVKLAQAFLDKQSASEWTYKIVGAKPEIIDPIKDGKTHLKYSVIVEIAKNQSVIDGPLILIVNLLSNEVKPI